ncbi:metallophosphoesterase [Dehalobacter sp. TeCB1]|uniref:metallophosphoesterase family protein n=1 Tax=Dehalobacter sp. TeCB1 TaxID=1843715 RepID=UPI00083B020C|nr:metallophosphoesterase [Dehalobacter sp. TeCB1]OCZ49833.1 hypothetical protein A7D23_00345 [Dehalobacter sp. TeCB1]
MNKYLKLVIVITGLLLLAACSVINRSENNQNIMPTPSVPSPQIQTDTQIGKDDSFRFVVMADCRGPDQGISDEAVKKTFTCIKKLIPQPSFAVMPGDLIGGAGSYSQEMVELQHFKDTITQYYPISFFYPGFGNHEATAGLGGVRAFGEVFSEFQADFLESYQKTVYFLNKGDARFYMLNSNYPGEDHMVSNTQLEWLKLNTDPQKKYNFYFFHEPAFPTGDHVGSSLDANKLQRDKLWQIIDQSKNPLVFCGHEHDYSRRHINSDFNETIGDQVFTYSHSVFQVTAGTFGAPVYSGYKDKKDVDVAPIPEYHFAVVDVDNSKIQVTVYNLNLEIIDSFVQTSGG